MRLLLAFLFFSAVGYAQSPVINKWKTIDDQTGKEKSVVEIFEKDGKVYGKIIRLFLDINEEQDPICLACDKEDDRHKMKIMGMEIIRDLKKSDNEYAEGTILDPENGNVYRCKIWVENNQLKVRGYLGPFYRTQTWLPVK